MYRHCLATGQGDAPASSTRDYHDDDIKGTSLEQVRNDSKMII